MVKENLGKYAIIGLSALSICELASMLVEYANDLINNYITNRILEKLKDSYEIQKELGKYSIGTSL